MRQYISVVCGTLLTAPWQLIPLRYLVRVSGSELLHKVEKAGYFMGRNSDQVMPTVPGQEEPHLFTPKMVQSSAPKSQSPSLWNTLTFQGRIFTKRGQESKYNLMITNPIFRKQRDSDFAKKNHSDYLPLGFQFLCVCGHMACRILFPKPGSNPCLLQWKCGFSTIEPPGKSLEF